MNVDVDPACQPDLLLTSHDLSDLPSRHFDEVLAWDVLEHIPHAYTMSALLDWAGLLVEGGQLVLQTSYVFGVIDSMRMNPGFETDYNWMRCLFGNQAHSGDFHHFGFTDRLLRTYVVNAGFRVDNIRIEDNWLIQCRATKVFDWTTAVGTDFDRAVRDTYFTYLLRGIQPDTLMAYQQEISGGRIFRDLIKEIICSPECLYKLGSKLDHNPTYHRS